MKDDVPLLKKEYQISSIASWIYTKQGRVLVSEFFHKRDVVGAIKEYQDWLGKKEWTNIADGIEACGKFVEVFGK